MSREVTWLLNGDPHPAAQLLSGSKVSGRFPHIQFDPLNLRVSVTVLGPGVVEYVTMGWDVDTATRLSEALEAIAALTQCRYTVKAGGQPDAEASET